MLEPRIVAISVSRFVAALAPADTGEAEAAKDATLRLDSGPDRAAGLATAMGTSPGLRSMPSVNSHPRVELCQPGASARWTEESASWVRFRMTPRRGGEP